MNHVGAVIGPLEIGPIAHGGHCVARFDGRVVFVRHSLPGEQVTVKLTDTSQRSYWRGDVEQVLRPSPDRVVPPCPVAGECGGCDFQHVALPAQRELKTAVVREQLQRLAGIDWQGEVQAVPVTEPDGRQALDDGLGWRTRMRYHAAPQGRYGLLAHRSHHVVPVPEPACPIAIGPPIDEIAELGAGADSVAVAVGEQVSVVADGALVSGPDMVRHVVRGRTFEVAPEGFWQVHPQAAEVLTDAVLAALAPEAGEQAFDLYSGVGLFAGALDALGVNVIGVESDRQAVATAEGNVPNARFMAARVDRGLVRLPKRTDLVVLDPPRAGAGRGVISQVVERQPRAVALVACDPASMARDLKLFADLGYATSQVRAFDLFPMTHHVECVAALGQTPTQLPVG